MRFILADSLEMIYFKGLFVFVVLNCFQRSFGFELEIEPNCVYNEQGFFSVPWSISRTFKIDFYLSYDWNLLNIEDVLDLSVGDLRFILKHPKNDLPMTTGSSKIDFLPLDHLTIGWNTIFFKYTRESQVLTIEDSANKTWITKNNVRLGFRALVSGKGMHVLANCLGEFKYYQLTKKPLTFPFEMFGGVGGFDMNSKADSSYGPKVETIKDSIICSQNVKHRRLTANGTLYELEFFELIALERGCDNFDFRFSPWGEYYVFIQAILLADFYEHENYSFAYLTMYLENGDECYVRTKVDYRAPKVPTDVSSQVNIDFPG